MLQEVLSAGSLTTEEQLDRWLRDRNAETSAWGRDKAKSVRDLLEEIEARESTLEVLDGVRAAKEALIQSFDEQMRALDGIAVAAGAPPPH